MQDILHVLSIVLPIIAAVVGFLVVRVVRGIDEKMTEHRQELRDVNERFSSLDTFIRSELRLMDVRLTRVESHLWPHHILPR